MIRLVDYRTEIEKDMVFGTCELCLYTADLTRGFFIFEDDEGLRDEIETGDFEWGEYYTNYYVENIPRFSEFIYNKNIGSFTELHRRFDDFYEEFCELEEQRKFWQRLTYEESRLYIYILLCGEVVAVINKFNYLAFSTDTRGFEDISDDDKDRIVQLCIKVSQGVDIEDLRV